MRLLKKFRFDNTSVQKIFPGIFVNGKHFSKLVSVALSCGVVEALAQE
jgi:hypothetical protein